MRTSTLTKGKTMNRLVNRLIGKIRKALVRAYARRVVERDPEILVAYAANGALEVARFMPRTRQVVVDIPLGLPRWLGGGACTVKFTAYSTPTARFATAARSRTASSAWRNARRSSPKGAGNRRLGRRGGSRARPAARGGRRVTRRDWPRMPDGDRFHQPGIPGSRADRGFLFSAHGLS